MTTIKDLADSILEGALEKRAKGICPGCDVKVGQYRNEASKREGRISGLCQKCQDEVFGAD